MSNDTYVPTPRKKRRAGEKVMPPLPESATRLAQEIHERAERALAAKLDGIELQVAAMVDTIVETSVREILGVQSGRISSVSPIGMRIVAAAEPRVVEVISAAVERIFSQPPETLLDPGAISDVRNRLRYSITSKVDAEVTKRVAELTPAFAERLVTEALRQVEQYYGAAKLIGNESGGGDAQV